MVARHNFDGVGEVDFDGHSDDTGEGYPYEAAIPPTNLSRENFDAYWSEEIVILYHALVDAAAERGFPLFDRMNVTDFADFAFANSSRVKP